MARQGLNHVDDVRDPLRDELELRRLVEAYGVAVDDRDAVALAALFVADGSLRVYEADSDEVAHAYGAGEFGLLTGALDRAYRRTFHLVGNVVLQIDGEQATGTVYCLASHIRDHDRGPQIAEMPVRYSDSFVRTNEGWRFSERIATILWHERRPANQRAPQL